MYNEPPCPCFKLLKQPALKGTSDFTLPSQETINCAAVHQSQISHIRPLRNTHASSFYAALSQAADLLSKPNGLGTGQGSFNTSRLSVGFLVYNITAHTLPPLIFGSQVLLIPTRTSEWPTIAPSIQIHCLRKSCCAPPWQTRAERLFVDSQSLRG